MPTVPASNSIGDFNDMALQWWIYVRLPDNSWLWHVMWFPCIKAVSLCKLDTWNFTQHNLGCYDASAMIPSFGWTTQVEHQSGSWDWIHRLCKSGNGSTVGTIAVIVSLAYTQVYGTKDLSQATTINMHKSKPVKWINSLDKWQLWVPSHDKLMYRMSVGVYARSCNKLT